MSDQPQEPECPPGRVPHKERIEKISSTLLAGQTGAVCIDDTPIHREWYLHELANRPGLSIVYQGVLSPGIYMIKVRKEA